MTSRPLRAVTILSGFLGSGKTTLLREYLKAKAASGTAVVINEVGAVGVDHHLVHTVAERSVLLKGGCACCSRREDLVETFRALLDRDDAGRGSRLDHVIVETTGLADPVPIQFTLATDPVLRHHFAPACVVITLDALNGSAQVTSQAEVAKQILAADRIVITKSDIAEPETVSLCYDRLAAMNPAAQIVVSRLGDRSSVLRPATSAPRPPPIRPQQFVASHHNASAATLGFSGQIDWPTFAVWLSMLLEAHGPKVLRIKGLLDVGVSGPIAINTAQHVVHPPEHLPHWPDKARRDFLVVISRGLETTQIARSLAAFQRAGGRSEFFVRELA